MSVEQTACAAIPHSPIRGHIAGLTLPAEPWAAPHSLTVSIRDDRTRMVLDTEDASIACELRLGPQGLLRTWQHTRDSAQEDLDAMVDWARTLIPPLVEPLRRSGPLDLTFAGDYAFMAALLLGEGVLPSTGRQRVTARALANWQTRFDVDAPHTDATLEVLATVILMRVFLEATQQETAVVLGNTLS
jgi:hypothetical protein